MRSLIDVFDIKQFLIRFISIYMTTCVAEHDKDMYIQTV